MSDVDELLRRSTVQLIRGCSNLPMVLQLSLPRFLYSFEFPDGGFDTHSAVRFYDPSEPKFASKVFSHQETEVVVGHGSFVLADAGWHCSFCFRYLDDFVHKMEAYSHSERARGAHKTHEHIQNAICNGRDLYGRFPDDAFTFKELIARSGAIAARQSSFDLPEYLMRNPERSVSQFCNSCEFE
jgi:beta-1,4-mannosyl-glycoprotein beta-1,4-N-acetylglucosaminyltransferase